MLKTYLKFAFRTFWRDRFYTLLNIIGLATGLAVSIIILLYLQNDLTYDQHHEQHRQIYRLASNLESQDGAVSLNAAVSAQVMAPLLQDYFPEIQSYVRFTEIGTTLVNVPAGETSQPYNEDELLRTDSTVFQVFTYPFLAGNPTTALNEPNRIVLTERLARKYFGEQEALGKTLWLGEAKKPYLVTGVMADLPDNSHLKFDGLLSGLNTRHMVNQNGEFNSEAIWNPDAYVYLLFPEDYSTADFFARLPPFYDQYIRPFGEQVNARMWFYLEPLADIHFYSKQDRDEPQGNIAYLYAFGGIGLAMLLLACINYMNIATARAGSRSKEVGVRKVLGSRRRALIFTFLGESLILSFAALVLALGLVELVLVATPFNQLVQKDLSLDLFHNPVLLGGALSLTVCMGLLSGGYPALYLPSLPTITSLKGALKSSASGLRLRKTLVTLQFVISIAVVLCTFLMRSQIDFMRTTDLGFDQEHLLLVEIQDTLVERQLPAIRHELQQHPSILESTTAYNIPGVDVNNQVFRVATDSAMTNRAFNVLEVSTNYLKTLGITLLVGRDFQESTPQDANGQSFIVNEAAAKALGWYQPGQPASSLEDALDQEIMRFHADAPGHVIGVVQDFNVTSLHNAVSPTILAPQPQDHGSYLYLRLRGDRLPETLDYVREQWATYDPHHPFEYSFLDQKFNEQYQADERQSALISMLSGLCLMISLLGVLGLSAYTAEQRTKEIGVRKVLGANVSQIIFLLFNDMLYLVLLASVIAAPLAYGITRYWMQDFAYRAEMNIFLFVLVAVAAMLIAFLTMSFHSLKTARRNPVDSLRNE